MRLLAALLLCVIALSGSVPRVRATAEALPHDAYIGTLAGARVEHEESVRVRVDAGDNLVAGPYPAGGGVADVGEMFVGALRVRFDDAGDLNVRHTFLPQS